MNQIGPMWVSTDGDIFRFRNYLKINLPDDLVETLSKSFFDQNRKILLGILSTDDRVPPEIWYNISLFVHETTLL
jgi:hypothetical protein